MIRDPVPGEPRDSSARPPFSLAKTQLFLWASVIFLSFILVYNITGDLNCIPNSAVALLGTSAATAAAVLIQDAVKNPKSGVPPSGEPPMPKATPFKKGWILWDLISDRQGVSWHRLQMLFWTALILGIFTKTVIMEMFIPEIPTELITLMGLSSASFFLGMLPENHSSQQS